MIKLRILYHYLKNKSRKNIYDEGILFLIKKKILYKAQDAAKITGRKVKTNLIKYYSIQIFLFPFIIKLESLVDCKNFFQ